MQTKKSQTNRPAKYLKPCCQPNAAPTPANDNTPGPGVINIKSETIIKASMVYLCNGILQTYNYNHRGADPERTH